MKKVLSVIVVMMQFFGINAQTSNDIYLIGTSLSIPESHTGIFNGFGKYVGKKESYTKTEVISFSIGSISKKYEMFLFHMNYVDSKEPDKVILDRPISDINNYSVIDIDNFIASKSRAQVWQWMIDNRDKKVWIIDRNDYYKSSPSLLSKDRMKLIQVEIWLDNIPDNFLNP